MLSSFTRARIIAISTVAGALLSQAAHAADMPFLPPASEPIEELPVEWGTGWYLRGDIGAAYVSPTTLNGVALAPSFPNNWNVGLGGGYKYNDWFRTDITVDYQSIYNKTGPQPVIMPCQIGAVGTPAGGPFTGSIPISGACSPMVQNRTESMLVLANAYLDLGTWGGFTPYVGTGAGVNVMYQKAQMVWYMSNLVPYAGTTWTDPFTQATYMANWDRAFSGVNLRFAWALMGGVSYDVTQHIKADLGYRFANLGKIDGVDLWNNRVSRDATSHQVRLGVRYVID